MRNLILLIMTICLIYVSCDDNRRDDGNDESQRETQSDMRETVSEPFLVTQDVEKDSKELAEDLSELKAEKRERTGADSTEFDRLVSEAEIKLMELEDLADEYKNAADEKRQDLYAEFKELKEELDDEIDEIKARFKKENE